MLQEWPWGFNNYLPLHVIVPSSPASLALSSMVSYSPSGGCSVLGFGLGNKVVDHQQTRPVRIR